MGEVLYDETCRIGEFLINFESDPGKNWNVNATYLADNFAGLRPTKNVNSNGVCCSNSVKSAELIFSPRVSISSCAVMSAVRSRHHRQNSNSKSATKMTNRSNFTRGLISIGTTAYGS